MVRFNPKSFSQPDLLKTIQPGNLIRLLEPCLAFLEERGLSLPREDGSEIDYLKLAGILAQPDEFMDSQVMEAAGLEARLQFGEVLWWFFPNASGMAFYDAYTTAAFQSANGRPLHLFLTPNDDPSVNGHIDADFLRQTVRDHVAAIRAYVLASHPNTQFEILWPLDVTDPDTRQLNRYINLPTEWTSKPTSGFDTFMIEGFQYAGLDRNIDKVRAMAGYPFEVLIWPRNDCRYLMGHFNAGWPWQRDFVAAQRRRVPVVKVWAYDHCCLLNRDNWPLSDSRSHRRWK